MVTLPGDQIFNLDLFRITRGLMNFTVSRYLICRKRTRSLFILFYSSFLISCSYAPEDENLVSVSSPSPNSSISLLEHGQVIELYEKKTIHFRVSPNDKRSYHAEIFIDNLYETSGTATSGDFYFTLDPKKFDNGKREGKIIVSYPSGTGSLADRLDEETVTTERTFQVLIDNVPPLPIEKPFVAIQNGKLMVSWKKPLKTNISYYMIYRRYYQGDKILFTDSIKVPDLATIQYYDASYVGGKVSYQVNLKGGNFYQPGVPEFFDCVPVEISFSGDLDIPQFSITKSLLFNYENTIEMRMTGDRNGSKLVTLLSASVIPTNNVKFGSEIKYQFNIVSRSTSSYEKPSYTIDRTAYQGVRIKKFILLQYAPKYAAYYLSTRDNSNGGTVKIYKLDAASMTITDSLVYSSHTTPYLIFSRNNDHNYVQSDDLKLKKLDLNTLDVIEEINLGHLASTNESIDIESWTTVTDDNIFAFDTDKKAFIVDLTTKATLWTQTSYLSPSLSADGTYLFFNGYLYKGNPSLGWTQVVSRITAADEGLIFRGDSDKAILFGSSSRLYSYDLTSPPNGGVYLISKQTTLNLIAPYYDPLTDTYYGQRYETQSERTVQVYRAEDF